MANKNAKKVSAPKTEKVVKPGKSVKRPKNIEVRGIADVQLLEFTCAAVIPTQQYGNIQPKISVHASSLEAARAVVMPFIEDLYKTYAELPLNGRDPKFYGNITETVKQVAPAHQILPTMPVATQESPKGAVASASPAEDATVAQAPVSAAPATPKPEPVVRAEKAIALADSADQLVQVQDQIEKSVKIPAEFKADLITKVLTRRGEFK